jgi:hypothetical protein
MRRLLPAALIFVSLGPLPGSQHLPAIDLTQRVAAHPLHFDESTDGSLRFVRGWHLTSPHSYFGGFSGIARIGPDRFQIVGDNGYWARLSLTPGGQLSGLRIDSLPTPEGRPRRKSKIDAEALVVDPESGKSWIAFEGINQIWRFDAALTRVESRRRSPALRRWSALSGPESMVRLADGRTILFAEAADGDPRGSEGLVYDDDPAAPGAPPVRFFYDAQGKGLVSDAAPLPDGRILLVHRRLGFDPVFTTVLGIVDPAGIGKDRIVRSRAIGRIPKPLADNYEGAAISVEGGRTWLWLVSDDNFNRWQRSLILQIELVDLPPARAPDSKKAAR